ncbi:MAG: 50S ribosomal protein L1 [Phycisphaerales bacterium]|jgi:large subunit ribosomal protein L1|nr:50S ribosomal protein L1 [Phycisphaerales bacterium]
MSEENGTNPDVTEETAVEATTPKPEDTKAAEPMSEDRSAWKARLARRRRRTRSGRGAHNRKLALAAAGPHPITEAIQILKTFKPAKFDQVVECCLHLGIDPRQADQQLRGALSMPKGTGKTKRVICFCGTDKVDDAKAAGAIEAGGEELGEKIKGGWCDFDVAIASPDMMRVVGQLGKVLGPKGLMPSPKAGTVTPDAINAVKEFSAGKSEYRNDDGGNLHIVIGRMSFSESDLTENLEFFLNKIETLRPAAVKGSYMKKCVISGTMTPGVEVAVS